ncbi:hypothetical protein DIPPA_00134 [Diplonema papillatum]|nr:hypothetical protein DIPPA_00134 [Diplonema papillatum]
MTNAGCVAFHRSVIRTPVAPDERKIRSPTPLADDYFPRPVTPPAAALRECHPNIAAPPPGRARFIQLRTEQHLTRADTPSYSRGATADAMLQRIDHRRELSEHYKRRLVRSMGGAARKDGAEQLHRDANETYERIAGEPSPLGKAKARFLSQIGRLKAELDDLRTSESRSPGGGAPEADGQADEHADGGGGPAEYEEISLPIPALPSAAPSLSDESTASEASATPTFSPAHAPAAALLVPCPERARAARLAFNVISAQAARGPRLPSPGPPANRLAFSPYSPLQQPPAPVMAPTPADAAALRGAAAQIGEERAAAREERFQLEVALAEIEGLAQAVDAQRAEGLLQRDDVLKVAVECHRQVAVDTEEALRRERKMRAALNLLVNETEQLRVLALEKRERKLRRVEARLNRR